MMKRRNALVAMAGMATVAATSTRSGRAAWQKSPEEMTLPELIKMVGPMMATVPVKAEPLAPGLSLITGPGGNITALVGPDGTLMVDSFVPGHGDELLAAVRKLKADGPITLVDTHWHFDHAGGNAALAAAGVKIVAHTAVRERLGTDQYVSDFAMLMPAAPKAALPVVTIDDSATYYLNGEVVHLKHVPPAHTDGDVFIHYKNANVLQTGDLFFNGTYPNIDSSSKGWITGMIAALDLILAHVDGQTKVVPGHGPVGNRDDVRSFRSMLVGVRDKVQPMVEAGKTLEEVIAAKPTASFDDQWGKGLFKGKHFAELAYNGLLKYQKGVASR